MNWYALKVVRIILTIGFAVVLCVKWKKSSTKHYSSPVYVDAVYKQSKVIHVSGDNTREAFSYVLALYTYTYRGFTYKVYVKNDARGFGKSFQQNYLYSFDKDVFPDKLELKINSITGKMLNDLEEINEKDI